MKAQLKIMVLFILSLSACNSSSSPSNAAPAVTPLSPEQQIAANFSQVTDDQSWLHNRAWKDASGVVWSEGVGSVEANDRLSNLELGCNRIGGTLPTSSQLDQLARYLGRGTPIGFHPEYLRDLVPGAGVSIVWNLQGNIFASSTLSGDSSTVIGMNGDTGEMEDIQLVNGLTQESVSALCTFPALRAQISCQIRTSRACSSFFSGKSPIEYNAGVAEDGDISAAVRVINADASGNVTMTLQLTDASSKKTASTSSVILPQQSTQATIDITDSKDGEIYELTCAAGGVGVQSLVGESCEVIR